MKTKRKATKLTDHLLADAANVSESTWRVHKQQGAPRPRNQRDVAAWVTRYQTWRQVRARKPGPAAAPTSPETARWTAERMRWLAASARIRVAREVGELVRRAEVVEFAGQACLVARVRLLDMCSKLAPRLVNVADEHTVQEILLAEVGEILGAFSKSMQPGDHGIAWPPEVGDAANASSDAPQETVSSGNNTDDADDAETEEPADVAGDTDPPATAGNP